MTGAESDKDVLGAQHERFRRIVQRNVADRLKYIGVDRRDWIVQCYRSIEEFEMRFPDSEARESILDKMEKEDLELRTAERNVLRKVRKMPPELDDDFFARGKS